MHNGPEYVEHFLLCEKEESILILSPGHWRIGSDLLWNIQQWQMRGAITIDFISSVSHSYIHERHLCNKLSTAHCCNIYISQTHTQPTDKQQPVLCWNIHLKSTLNYTTVDVLISPTEKSKSIPNRKLTCSNMEHVKIKTCGFPARNMVPLLYVWLPVRGRIIYPSWCLSLSPSWFVLACPCLSWRPWSVFICLCLSLFWFVLMCLGFPISVCLGGLNLSLFVLILFAHPGVSWSVPFCLWVLAVLFYLGLSLSWSVFVLGVLDCLWMSLFVSVCLFLPWFVLIYLVCLCLCFLVCVFHVCVIYAPYSVIPPCLFFFVFFGEDSSEWRSNLHLISQRCKDQYTNEILRKKKKRLKQNKKYKMILRDKSWSASFTANKPLWGHFCFLFFFS